MLFSVRASSFASTALPDDCGLGGLDNTRCPCNSVDQESGRDSWAEVEMLAGLGSLGEDVLPHLFPMPAFLGSWPLLSSEPGMAVESLSLCITVIFLFCLPLQHVGFKQEELGGHVAAGEASQRRGWQICPLELRVCEGGGLCRCCRDTCVPGWGF